MIDKVPAFFMHHNAESGIYQQHSTSNMGTVTIKYIGQFEPLMNQKIKISPESVTDGHVYSLAKMAIWDEMSKLPGYDSWELPDDLWEPLLLGGREFLLYWKVVQE